MIKLKLKKWSQEHITKAVNLNKIGKSNSYIAKILNRTQNSISKKLIREGYKNPIKNQIQESKYSLLDWNVIQQYYDNGFILKEVLKKFKINRLSLKWGIENGKLKCRTQSENSKLLIKKRGPRLQTKETKEKISIIRKKFLDENPDKVPYLLNHSSKISYPERIFMEELKRRSIIGWDYNLRIGRYLFDFGFKNIKLDVEIDGKTHLEEKVIKKDIERDIFSKSNGWTVKRFTAKEVKSNLQECVNQLEKIIEMMNHSYVAPLSHKEDKGNWRKMRVQSPS